MKGGVFLSLFLPPCGDAGKPFSLGKKKIQIYLMHKLVSIGEVQLWAFSGFKQEGEIGVIHTRLCYKAQNKLLHGGYEDL